MKEERILDAIGNINEKLIFEAMDARKPTPKAWIRRFSVAACLALTLAIVVPYAVGVVSAKGGSDDLLHTDLGVLTLSEFGGAYYEILDMSDRKVLDRYHLPHEITVEMIGTSLGSGKGSNGEAFGNFYLYTPYEDVVVTVRENGDTRPMSAVYIVEEDGEYSFALFCNYLMFDDTTHQEASEMFAVYGIDEAEDIASIKIDGKTLTDRGKIEQIYNTIVGSLAMGNEDFQRAVYGGKNESEQQDLSRALSDEAVTLRIESREGAVTGNVQYYPSIGFLSWALNYYRLDEPIEY